MGWILSILLAASISHARTTYKPLLGYDVVEESGKTFHTGYKPVKKGPRNQVRYFPSHLGDRAFEDLPLEYDLRKDGSIVIDNQRSCGSCWWFATKGTMQDAVALRDKKTIDISGQWGTDCSGCGSCGGGNLCFKPMVNLGAMYTSDYGPYLASNRRCNRSFNTYHEKALSYSDVALNMQDIKRAIFDNRTTLAVCGAAAALGNSSDGWVERAIRAGTNHCYRMIGWLDGATHGRTPGVYGIFANSWGENWSDGGFAYVLMSRDDKTVIGSVVTDAQILIYKPPCEPQAVADASSDEVNIVLSPDMSHSVRIGTPALAGMTYEWSPADGLSDPHVAQPLAAPAKTTKYTVKVTSQCSVATSSIIVHVFRPMMMGARRGSKLIEVRGG